MNNKTQYDIYKLYNLSNKCSNNAYGKRKKAGNVNYQQYNKNRLETKINGMEEVRALQRMADIRKQEREKIKAIYNEHSDNMKKTSSIQTRILKSMEEGENIYCLFLEACNAISLMTSNNVFYKQVKEKIIGVYGHGFDEPLSLRVEIKNIKERLNQLNKAYEKEKNDNIKSNIKKAILKHEQKINDLNRKIRE